MRPANRMRVIQAAEWKFHVNREVETFELRGQIADGEFGPTIQSTAW